MTAGRHLIIDGIFTNNFIDKLSDREYLSDYLEQVTKVTGMTLVFPPMAMSFPFAGETNRLIRLLDEEGKCNDSEVYQEFKKHIENRNTCGGGVSAIAVWLESHCTLHSWTEKNYVSVDLFSCSTYDINPVIDYTVKVLGLDKASFVVVDRYMDGRMPWVRSFDLLEYTANKVNDMKELQER